MHDEQQVTRPDFKLFQGQGHQGRVTDKKVRFGSHQGQRQ